MQEVARECLYLFTWLHLDSSFNIEETKSTNPSAVNEKTEMRHRKLRTTVSLLDQHSKQSIAIHKIQNYKSTLPLNAGIRVKTPTCNKKNKKLMKRSPIKN